MRAEFAHLYELKDGRIKRMQQYADTAMARQALVAGD